MKKLSYRGPLLALVLAAGLSATQGSLAQGPGAALAGKVAPTDKVVVRNVDTGFTREVKVKDDGDFAIRRLPVGTYEVTITHADGTEEKIQVAARIGITTRVQ
jgi:hypothetical protein